MLCSKASGSQALPKRVVGQVCTIYSYTFMYLQTSTNVYERLRTSTNVYKRLQTSTNVYKRLQTSTNNPTRDAKKNEGGEGLAARRVVGKIDRVWFTSQACVCRRRQGRLLTLAPSAQTHARECKNMCQGIFFRGAGCSDTSETHDCLVWVLFVRV